MKKEYIPFQVIMNGKKDIWQMDVTNLNGIELMKLKNSLKGKEFSPTMTCLDRLIYTNLDELNGMRGNKYAKEEKKRNKTRVKQKKPYHRGRR